MHRASTLLDSGNVFDCPRDGARAVRDVYSTQAEGAGFYGGGDRGGAEGAR
jgi:hypothetical protein